MLANLFALPDSMSDVEVFTDLVHACTVLMYVQLTKLVDILSVMKALKISTKKNFLQWL